MPGEHFALRPRENDHRPADGSGCRLRGPDLPSRMFFQYFGDHTRPRLLLLRGPCDARMLGGLGRILMAHLPGRRYTRLCGSLVFGRILMAHLPGRRYTRLCGSLVFGRILMAHLPGRRYTRLCGSLVFGRILMAHLPGLRYTRLCGSLVFGRILMAHLPGRRYTRLCGSLVFCLSWRRETFVLRWGLGACGLVSFGAFFQPGKIHGSSVRRSLSGSSGFIGSASRVSSGGGLVSRSASRPTFRRPPVSRILMDRASVGRFGVVRLSGRWLSVSPTLGSRRIVIR